ncbi:MAG: ribose-phosphate diphosphokinase [Alphaproteobacteria bacterium]|jgi:ribose-phosphate pyrophosphokinase|nr:ribose-phosphate diphosphokinase [Candidatus Jidaibacter sp.]
MDKDFTVLCFNGYEQYYRAFITAGLTLSKPDEYSFEEGDSFFSTSQDLKNKHIYIVGSLNRDTTSSTNDRLTKVLFFIDMLKENGATKLTLIAPYICYSRMEKRSSSTDLVANNAVARLLESVGLDSIVTFDVHNQDAFQDSYKIEAKSLEAHSLFCDYYASLLQEDKICVVSPDSGGIERATKFAQALEKRLSKPIKFMHFSKTRDINNISIDAVDGCDIDGYTAIIYDDIVSTGKTMLAAAEMCKQKGADKIYGAATHLLNQDFTQSIGVIDGFISTNSVPQNSESLDITKLIAEYIKSDVQG